MVFLLDDQHPDPGVRNVRYRAISLSSAAPVYPSVEEVLRQLKLQSGGFKEVHRFTASVADFGGRTPEPIRFTAGHAYMFAVVFRPGPVDLGMAEKESLGFLVNVDKDPLDREGLFSEDVGNSSSSAKSLKTRSSTRRAASAATPRSPATSAGPSTRARRSAPASSASSSRPRPALPGTRVSEALPPSRRTRADPRPPSSRARRAFGPLSGSLQWTPIRALSTRLHRSP